MKTLADVKRTLQWGRTLIIEAHEFPRLSRVTKVMQVQTTKISTLAWRPDIATNGVSTAFFSWLDYGWASTWEIHEADGALVASQTRTGESSPWVTITIPTEEDASRLTLGPTPEAILHGAPSNWTTDVNYHGVLTPYINIPT